MGTRKVRSGASCTSSTTTSAKCPAEVLRLTRAERCDRNAYFIKCEK